LSALVKRYVKNPKVLLRIQNLDITPLEKEKLTEVIGLIYHQKLLNELLLRLDEESKRLFLEKHFSENQNEALSFLEEQIEDIEDVVEKALIEIEEKLLEDLEGLRNI
jgi:hypothetical protein